MTSADVSKKLVKAWNSGKVDEIAGMYAPDVVMHHPLVPAPLKGRDAVKEFEGVMFTAFSDVDWQATAVVANGSDLAVEFQVQATNSAPIPSPKGMIPATNKR